MLRMLLWSIVPIGFALLVMTMIVGGNGKAHKARDPRFRARHRPQHRLRHRRAAVRARPRQPRGRPRLAGRHIGRLRSALKAWWRGLGAAVQAAVRGAVGLCGRHPAQPAAGRGAAVAASAPRPRRRGRPVAGPAAVQRRCRCAGVQGRIASCSACRRWPMTTRAIGRRRQARPAALPCGHARRMPGEATWPCSISSDANRNRRRDRRLRRRSIRSGTRHGDPVHHGSRRRFLPGRPRPDCPSRPRPQRPNRRSGHTAIAAAMHAPVRACW